MKRRGRTLTAEEQALWREVAKTTARRKTETAAPPVAAAPPLGPIEIAPPAPTPEVAPAFRILKPTGRSGPPISTPAPLPRRASGLDKRTETRLRKGERDPDARLDLHGMTAQRAHGALSSFISRSRRAGHRMVLVITGKGAVGAPREFGDPTPGVLRREAPVWLSTPPLSGMIVNVSQAHPRHGGGGALYVYLKKIR